MLKWVRAPPGRFRTPQNGMSHDREIAAGRARAVPLDAARFQQQGQAWTAKVPESFGPGDSADAPTASRLVVYEDDLELGPAHTQHETIRQRGGGAYSHWQDTLYFSTSDGSDPRSNGRSYRIVLRSLKLAVIGLDGSDPLALRRYLAEGRLPNIAGIVGRSRAVETSTDGELFINSYWPNFAGGLSVGSHGVHAFLPLRSGTMQLVESKQYPVPAPFWEIAARAGVATCVLDVPHYAPPAAGAPANLSYVEWGPHPPVRPPGSVAPDLIKQVLRRYGPHPCPIDVEAAQAVQDAADMAALLCIGARKRASIVNDLLRLTNPELFVTVFPEVHTAAHQWLNAETPGHRRYDAAMVDALGSPIRQVYEAVDAAIGQIVAQLPPDTTAMLVCLGGVRVTHGGAYLLHDLLERLGHAAYPDHHKGLVERLRSSLQRLRPGNTGAPAFDSPPGLNLDWTRTRAFALPWAYDGYLRVNQRGREPGGIVDAGAERERLLAEIEQAVRELRIAGTDRPAAKSMVRAQKAFSGAASAELPDLMVLWNSDRPFDAVESARVGRIENRDPAGRSAHNALGGLFAYGPLIADGPPMAGYRDIDIAPTILALLGVKVPDHLEGRVISDMIASGVAAAADTSRARALAG